MQIPSSISSGSYPTSAANRQNIKSPESTRAETQREEPKPAAQSRSSNIQTDTPSEPRERNFAPVEAVQAPELSNQDLRVRESKPEENSNSQAINNYQQIAREGADNAKAQDPSLFRIDVYV